MCLKMIKNVLRLELLLPQQPVPHLLQLVPLLLQLEQPLWQQVNLHTSPLIA